MQAIGYYISLPFLYGLSYLPFWLLYVFSDLTFFLVYYIIGYRKKVVHQNLANAFPDRSPAERLTIERQFYRFFCDLIFETVKCLTISERELLRRVEFPEDAAFYETARQQRSIIAVMGHYGNWEM
ncbi:MAG: lipid A biosynthesis acyltransferase, partial [Bacteroidota bacterium]